MAATTRVFSTCGRGLFFRRPLFLAGTRIGDKVQEEPRKGRRRSHDGIAS
jgi:hypothetical protein